MRQLFAAAAAAVLCLAGSASAANVEVKEVHLCCGACVRGAEAALKGVAGVSSAKADRNGKAVTFTAQDEKAAAAGVKALYDAGFYGAASADGKALKIDVVTPKKGEKADAVTVKKVHLCCPACKKAVDKLFAGSKVEYPEKDVAKITGKDLDKAEIIQTLRKAGFNGTIE